MDAATFLTRVLPTHENAYLNLHFFSRDEAAVAKGLWGRAFLDVAEMANFASWASSRKNCVYFCCASQIRAEVSDKVNQRGKPQFKAIRSASNARAMKSLWMDIDVAKNGAYATVNEAVSEVADFCTATGIPKPTIIVASGSGVHVYWTLTLPVTADEWKVMATALKQAAQNHGLKQDPTRTADAASILRVPDTLNWKNVNDPKPVAVLGSRPADIDTQLMKDTLQPFVVRTLTASTPALAPGMGDMTAGVSMQARPVNLEEVAPNCAVLQDAITTGGADHEEPLWYQMIRMATYAENGLEWAHKLSKGHPDYQPTTTENKFQQAVSAKEQNDLGWPKCKSFAQYRSALCQACPRYPADKSPLNFRNENDVAPDDSNDLPRPYFRHQHTKLIMVPMVDKGKDEDGNSVEIESNVPVLDYAMWDAELINDGEKSFLRFKAQQVKMRTVTVVSIPLEKLADQKATLSALGARGIMVTQFFAPKIREFLMSWVKKLQTLNVATKHDAFGWIDEGEKVVGFSYGGHVQTDGDPLPVIEAPLTTGYSPTGDYDHWRAACKAVLQSGRPQIDAIIASAFAAPLVRFAEQRGMVLSFVGDTGAGKTTAINVAMAVWGDPHSQKNSVNDTVANLSNKLGILRSLPVYWDEVREINHSRTVAELVFRVAEGKDKSRMSASLERREGRTWNTMMVVGSNNSMLEYVADASPESTAGLMRVVEIRVPPVPAQQRANFTAMDEVVGKVSRNYGHAGLIYAKYLGAHAEEVRERFKDVRDKVNMKLKCTNEERLWAYAITTLIVGAELSVKLGLTDIDVPKLAEFLLTDVMHDMRVAVGSEGVGGAGTKDPVEIIAEYLGALQPDRYLATDTIPAQNQKIVVTILSGDIGRQQIRRVDAHCIVNSNQLRVARRAFMEYLKELGMYRRGFVKELEDRFGVTSQPMRLGLGTPYATPTPEPCLVFDLTRKRLATLKYDREVE